MAEMPRKEVPPPLELVKSRIEEVLPPDAKEKVDSGDFALIDTRDPAQFEAGHIPGAVNVPAGESARDARSEEFAGKIAEATAGKTALLYCNTGNRSARAADALRNELGVEDSSSLVGGITLWNDLGYPIEGEILADDDDTELGAGMKEEKN